MADIPDDKTHTANTTLQTRSYGYDVPEPATKVDAKNTPSETPPYISKINNIADKVNEAGTKVASGFTFVQDKALTLAGQDPEQYDPNALMDITMVSAGSGFALNRAIVPAIASIRNYAQNTLPMTHAESMFSPRERMGRQLLMQGHASVDEIMRSSYGEWPPKGLDIVGQNDQRVRLAGVLTVQNRNKDSASELFNPAKLWERTKENIKALKTDNANAYMGGDRDIGINHLKLIGLPGLLGQSAISSSLGHEGVHILQGDYSYRAEKLFGSAGRDYISHAYNTPIAHSDLVADGLFEKYTRPELNEFLATKEAKSINYLREGAEIQARMHQILSDGYQRWGVMPQNKEQLLVAMENGGLKLPEDIKSQLDTSPTIEETRSIFARTPPKITRTSLQIEDALNTLSPAGHTQFMNQTMPIMYSNLIEMYGDKEGRARFGFGENSWPEIRARAQAEKIVQENSPAPPETKLAEPVVKPVAAVEEGIHLKGRVRGGLLVNAAIGAGAGVIALGMGKSVQESGEISFELAVPYGETALKIHEGDKKGAVHSAMTETAGIAGAMGGAAAGGMAGAAIGSIVPVIGTAVVGAVGAVVGGIAGGFGASIGTDALLTEVPEITDTVTKGVDATMAAFSGDDATIKTAQPSPELKNKITVVFSGASRNPPLNTAFINEQQKNLLEISGLDHLERNGKVIDTEAILRNPAQRQDFIDGLENSARTSQNPDVRLNIEGMIKASRSYIVLENRREERPAEAAQKNPETNPMDQHKTPQSIQWK